jgi:hypothetical protein
MYALGGLKDIFRVNWSAYATVDGERTDISQFEVSYLLDQVPMAKFTPTVGRDPVKNKKGKGIDIISDALPFTPVEIFMRGDVASGKADSPRGTSFPGFPLGQDVKIFEGFYTQAGYTGATGNVATNGLAFGWLGGLYGSSPQTVGTTAKGGGGFNELANITAPGGGITMNEIQMAITFGKKGAIINLWKNFVKEMFKAIAANKDIWGEGDNDIALQTIERMDNPADFPFATANNNIPFPAAEGVPESVLAEWLANSVGLPLFMGWRQSNFWDYLAMQFSNDFQVHIVPTVDSASVAAVFPNLGGDPFVTIEPNEYSHIDLKAVTPSLMRKFALVGTAGQYLNNSAQPRPSGIRGLYNMSKAWGERAVRGETIANPAPTWMEAEHMVGEFTQLSLGGETMQIPDALDPISLSQSDPTKSYSGVYNNFIRTDLGDRFAKTAGLSKLFASRSGAVTGRMRTDIAPGSMVRIGINRDKGQGGGTKRYVFGMVDAVVLSMSNEGGSGRAFTNLSVKNYRTQQEHESDVLTSNNHPMYNIRYVGTRLIPQ